LKRYRFHKDFKLNEISFSSNAELLMYAQDFSYEIHLFLQSWFSNDDFIIVETSGSTGVPKEIKLQKQHMINSACATGNYFDLKENTSALLCLSVNYIAGKMMFIRALSLGWHLDVVKPDIHPLKDLKKKYDFSAMVPLQLEHSINSLNLIKTLIVGGGVVSKKLQQRILHSTCVVFATYGMTETITHIAVKKLNNLKKLNSSQVENSYYKVLPNIEIYKDQRDCLVINAAKVSNKIIFTNDIVSLISDTQFEWLGRFDTVINSGGVKLHPEKIEEKLAKIIASRFFIAGIPDSKLGEKLILVVEGKPHIINTMNVSLSKFQIPKEIYFVNQFVETKTRKIQRTKTLNLIRF